jgi:hypothetical protein
MPSNNSEIFRKKTVGRNLSIARCTWRLTITILPNKKVRTNPDFFVIVFR